MDPIEDMRFHISVYEEYVQEQKESFKTQMNKLETRKRELEVIYENNIYF